MQMMESAHNNVSNRLVRLLGQETEIELRDGEVLHGIPMEITYPRMAAAHLMFEAAHGEYLCFDLNEIGSIRQCQPESMVVSQFPAF